MPANRPDTSPQNIARVLRELAGRQQSTRTVTRQQVDTLRALADALDTTPAPMTWEERLDRLMPTAWPQMTEKEKRDYLDQWTPVIGAAFPELASTDD
jgi:hypothetical protein